MVSRQPISVLPSQENDTVSERKQGVTLNPSSLQQFLRENGWLLLLSKILTVPPRLLRDALLSRQLGAPGLRFGRAPRLIGLRHIRLGQNLNAGNDCWLEAVTNFGGTAFEPILIVGDNCNFSDQVHIGCTNRVTIGAGLLCGSHVLISDHSHGQYSPSGAAAQSDPRLRPALRPLSHDKTIHIGANVWLGNGVAVLGGARIGDGAIVGVNAVVTGEIPPHCIAVGVPARPVRRWDALSASWLPYEDGDAQRSSVILRDAPTTL